MKKFMRLFALMLSLLMIVGLFAACNNNGDDVTDPSGTDAVKKEVLKVATNADFPPFEALDDNGDYVGFDIDLMYEIGERLNMEIQFDNLIFEGVIAAVGTTSDAAIAGLTIDETRLESVDFSDSYFTAKQNVIVLNDSEIETVEDLKGLRIGAQSGTTGADIAEEIEDVVFSGYDKAAMAVLDLMNGSLDAVIVDRNPAAEFVNVNEGIKAIGDDFFEDEFYAIAVKKGNTELLDKINTALAEIIADGTYDTLVTKHIVADAN